MKLPRSDMQGSRGGKRDGAAVTHAKRRVKPRVPIKPQFARQRERTLSRAKLHTANLLETRMVRD